ncbi:MAG TPA: TolC family protein [Candidatus Hydrogenedentes bacterium]|nr:TolC family protein [Candidatus Hydrogenedentota bacterium]HRT21660.1 TolC family protein [Candidatus Hydrogenedentota bacterium]HRT66890.1 TolC family protein [Candidatus Hydrogenedentota bacterium]
MRFVIVLLVCMSFVAVAQPPQTDAAPADPASPPVAIEDKDVALVADDVLKGFETFWASEENVSANALALDIRQCVETALSRNAQVLVADDEIAAAKANIGQAESARRPQVKVQEAFIRVDGLQNIEIPGLLGRLFGGGLNSFQGKKDQRRDVLSISQVLFAGGQIQAAVKASEYLAQSKEWTKQAKLNTLEFEVKQAYYNCLLARAMVRVADESVVTFKRHLGDAEKMLEVGLISNFEVLRAKTEVGAREADLVAAGNAARLALINLRRLLALPENTDISLVGKMDWTPLSEAQDQLVAEALETRPELQALNKGLAAASQNIRRTKGQFLPSAAASATWTNVDGGGQAQPDGWTLSVGAEWQVYAGGKRRHDVAEARAQKSSLEHQIEDVKRLIELDVRAAYIQAEDAAARVKKEKGTVELAREGRRLAELRFQEGVGTQTEILDAALALTAAETALVRAVHDYAVAVAAVDKAAGRGSVKSVEAAGPNVSREKSN